MLGLQFLLSRYMSVLYRYKDWLAKDSARPWYGTVVLMAVNVVGTLYLAEHDDNSVVQIIKTVAGLVAALLVIPFFWVTGRVMLRDWAQLPYRKNRR